MSCAKFIILVIFTVFIENIMTTDFCTLCDGEHTFCKFPTRGPSPKCAGYISSPLSKRDQALLLMFHNTLRRQVAKGDLTSGIVRHPNAANMLEMWDDELAELAQRWADQCVPLSEKKQHDSCRTVNRFSVAQNVASMLGSTDSVTTLRDFFDMWYQEIDYYDVSTVSHFKTAVLNSHPVGHFTQLIWANSEYLGCGKVHFKELMAGEEVYIQRIVCNYGPAGNVLNHPVYVVGPPCSRCPKGYRCSKALCQVDPIFPYTTTPKTTKKVTTTRKPTTTNASREPTTTPTPKSTTATPTTTSKSTTMTTNTTPEKTTTTPKSILKPTTQINTTLKLITQESATVITNDENSVTTTRTFVSASSASKSGIMVKISTTVSTEIPSPRKIGGCHVGRGPIGRRGNEFGRGRNVKPILVIRNKPTRYHDGDLCYCENNGIH